MRLTSIQAQELFSFSRLQLDDLPQTLVVVGPNGGGKTNLLRLMEVAVTGLDRAANFSNESYQALVRFAASRRIGAAPADVSAVRLAIVLTEPEERELLVRFVRAVIASALLQGTATNSDVSGVVGWIREHITDALLAPLASGAVVVEFADTPSGPWTTGYEFEVGGQQYRWVLDGMPTRGAVMHATDVGRLDVAAYGLAQKLNLDERRVPTQPFTLADLLPARGEARTLSLDAGRQWAELTREFAVAANISADHAQRQGSSLATVLQTVLERGLMVLGDLREPPRSDYTVGEAAYGPSSIDGSSIPVRLFRLKNGTVADRRQYAAIQALFRQLTGRTFDVALAAAPRADSNEPAPDLQISVLLEHGDQELPIEYAGAGFWESLLLSAVLPQSAGQVAILDEPARNLHPTLQRRLLTEMRAAPGQFIVTTHSPYLVAIHDHLDLAGLVRLDIRDGATCARRLGTSGGQDSARLRKALGESADARALLFARGVVLVEGGTELGALPEWFSKSAIAQRFGTPDALNVALFSVDGDLSFGTFVAFVHAFRIQWVIVCDGAVYKFGSGKKQIFEQIIDNGVDDPHLRQAVGQVAAGHPAVFAQLRSLGEGSGIFTLADDWDAPAEGFEAYVEKIAPGELAAAASVVGRSKPRQGRHVASVTACPPAVNDLYGKLLHHLGIT